MSLIEVISYDDCKSVLSGKRYNEVSYAVDSNNYYDYLATEHGAIDITELEDELLKYRREHNIFEVGDRVVKTHPKNTILWPVLGVYKNGGVWLDFNGFCWKPPKVRHATDAEIQEGRRL